MKNLTNLEHLPVTIDDLVVERCGKLTSIRTLRPELIKLSRIRIIKCDLFKLDFCPVSVEELEIKGCDSLLDQSGIDIENGELQKLSINGNEYIYREDDTLYIKYFFINDCTMISRVFGKQFEEGKLKKIKLSDCKQLKSLSNLPRQVEELDIRYCDALQYLKGIDFDKSNIKKINLCSCTQLSSLSKLPKQVEEIEIRDCDALQDLNRIDYENGKLKKLTINGKKCISQKDETLNINNLAIKDCAMISRVFGKQFEEGKLKRINLSDCQQLSSLSTLPKQIEEIIINNCENINENQIDSNLQNYQMNKIEARTTLFKANTNQRQVIVWNMNSKKFEYFNSVINSYNDKISILCIKSSPQIKDLKRIQYYNNISIVNCESFNSLKGVDILKDSLSLRISDCKKFSSLKGIQVMNKIEMLDLHNNSITDVSPLEKLISLTELNLSNNSIAKINIIKSLINLQTLNISKNKIQDINQLNGFQQLVKLSAFNCSGNLFCSNVLNVLAFILPKTLELICFGVEHNEENRIDIIKEIFDVAKGGANPFEISKTNEHFFFNQFKLERQTIKSQTDSYTLVKLISKQENNTATKTESSSSTQQLKQSDAVIYKAIAQKIPKFVAIKIQQNSNTYKREAKTLKLNHYNIIPPYDEFIQIHNKNESYGFLVMPLALQLEEIHPSIQLNTLISYTTQIIDAIIFIHLQKTKIMHRDIKPANIMFLQEQQQYSKQNINRPVLIDFGTCSFGSEVAKTETGTGGFMAPEVFNEIYNERCDTFSLGKTIQFWLNQYQGKITELDQKITIENLKLLAEWMSQADPNDRPKLDQVMQFLKGERVKPEQQNEIQQNKMWEAKDFQQYFGLECDDRREKKIDQNSEKGGNQQNEEGK